MQISILELLMSQIQLGALTGPARASPSPSPESAGLFEQLLEQLAPDEAEEPAEAATVGLTPIYVALSQREGVSAVSGREPPDGQGLDARPVQGEVVLGETPASPPSVAGLLASEASRIAEFVRGPVTQSLDIGKQPASGSAVEPAQAMSSLVAEVEGAATTPKPESNASVVAQIGRDLPFLGSRAESAIPSGGQPGLLGQATRQDVAIRGLLPPQLPLAEIGLADHSRRIRGSTNDAREVPVDPQNGLRSLAKTAALLEGARMRPAGGLTAAPEQLRPVFASETSADVALNLAASRPLEAETVSSLARTSTAPMETVPATAATVLAAGSSIVRSVVEGDPARSEWAPGPALHGAVRPAEAVIPPEPASVRPTMNAPDRVPVERVGEAVVRSVQFLAGRDGDVIRIRLIPASLGEVHIVVKSDGQSMNVHLAVASVAVREALEQQLPGLQDALNREGFDVTRVTVSTGFSHDATTHGGLARHDHHTGPSQPNGQDGPDRGPHRHGESSAMTGHTKQHDGSLDVLV